MGSRLFGYNSGAPISGASQSGNLAVSNDFTAGGAIKWWNGPNEELGYVIGYPDTTGLRKSNGSLIGSNAVGFVRTLTKTDAEFLSLANSLTGQNFTVASTATNWLNTNGYYTSYGTTEGFTNEYKAILAEAATLGYAAPSSDQKAKQDLFIKSLKSSGVWDKSDVLFVFANDGSKEFACINWKSPSGTKASLVNPTFLTFTPNAGFTGNGTSSYIDTGYSPNGSLNYKQNDASRYAYLKINDANKIIDGVALDISNSMTTYASTFQRVNQAGFNLSTSISYSGVGMKSIHRTSSIDLTCYNDTTATSATASSTALNNSTQCILRSASGYGTHQVSFYLMGASLVSENSSLVSAFSTYLGSL
jgi:hypothetical protein